MKRSITLILLLALFSGMLTGCSRPDAKYAPPNDGEDYKWVCDEIDMWFLGVKRDENTYFIGELTLDGETTLIDVGFPIGGGITVDEFFGFDDLVYSLERMRFCGNSRFREGWFSLQVDERFIDYVGFKKLKFRRVRLDEEDLAWIEALDTQNPTTPSQTPPIATEPPVNSAEPVSDAPPTVTYPVPDFLEGTVSIQTFLAGEDISYLCQSNEIDGAVTSDGRLLFWYYDWEGIILYQIDDLQNIVKAWPTNSHIWYTHFALDRDGQLWAFGGNRRGLMPGYEIEEMGPVVVMDHIISFTMGCSNRAWAAAVTDHNEVLVWGWLDGDNLVPPTVIATDAVSAITSSDGLYIVTEKGDLVDFGWGPELLEGNVVRTLVKENAVWGCRDYALGADGVLYYRENSQTWTVAAEDVKMANCEAEIAFYLTNTGELYAWENEAYVHYSFLNLPASPTGEKYIKLLDNVAMAAQAQWGITAQLDDGTMLRITVNPDRQTAPSD